MIASSKNSSAPESSPTRSNLPHTGRFVSIGKASKLLGISPQSLRDWEKAGKLTAYRTCGNEHGHRRYLLSQLEAQALGVNQASPISEGGRKIAIYVRVSTRAQADSLKRQTERLLASVSEREGIEQGAIEVFTEIGSSFGDRPKLNALISQVIKGRIERIYCENADRLSRMAALTRMIEHLCKEHHTELVCLDREELNPDEQQQSMMELVEYVHVLSVRSQSRKAAERKRKVLTPEALEAIRTYQAQGLAIKHSVDKANANGFTTEKGEPISYRVVQRYLSRITPKMVPIEVVNTAEMFWKAHIHYKKGNKVQAGALQVAFVDWCRKNKLQAMSPNKFGAWIRANAKVTTETKCGYVWMSGIELKGYASVVDAKGEYAAKYSNGITPLELTYLGRKGNKRPRFRCDGKGKGKPS